MTEGKKIEAVTWWVVELESATNDKIGTDRFCKVKDKSFYKKGLGEHFLILWLGKVWDQWAYMKEQVDTVINLTFKATLKRPL